MDFRSFFVLLAVVTAAAGAQAQSAIERGRYLVEAVMACDGCHTPRAAGNLDMSRRFSGGDQVWSHPAYTVRGTNISADRETGIGSWSEADLKRSLIEGTRPNGVVLAPQMPVSFYRVLTPGDLDAVVAFVRSIPPVRREVPGPVYKQQFGHDPIPGGERPFSQSDLDDKIKRGFYLATIAHCMECHARKPDGSFDYRGNWGKGGHEMKGPFGSVVVSNITSHPEKGIGRWTDAEIRRALVEGKGRDGRAFKPPMARQVYYSRMTDQDLDAMISWLRTIPPLE
jgi:mono/diheme cytochrome c family protein